MSKQAKYIVLICVAVVGTWLLLRYTNTFNYYRIVSVSMSPTLEPGDLIFVSKLKKPSYGDIIVFLTEEQGAKTHYVHRAIAFGGDVLEIKNGLVYVNHKLKDDSLKLKFEYGLSDKEYFKISQRLERDKIEPAISPIAFTGDSMKYLVFLTAKQAKEYAASANLRRVIYPKGFCIDNNLFQSPKDTCWTVDNYGPITIPDGYCFQMGDNRHNALDSRYTGFVSMKDVEGTVLGK